jgi:DNA-binding transcriptional MerR regulator
MEFFLIKDLETISGIKSHTIRIWEKRFNLIIPLRTQTNIRYYTNENLKKLLNISILNRSGIKISKIAKLNDKELKEKVLMVSHKSLDTETLLENLILSTIELDELKFEDILTNLIVNNGIEDTFIKVLKPFFERIGILWQTGSIMPAQEHLISALVRQKLIVAIDSLRNHTLPDKKSFLLFLPEEELHELGLLLYQYILKKRGYPVIYLGQSVPLEDLIKIIKIKSVDCFLTSMNLSMLTKTTPALIRLFTNELKEKSLYLAVSNENKEKKKLPKNIIPFSSTLELIDNFL